MEVINGDPAVAQQRKDGYAERYVTLRAKGETSALFCATGVEIHQTDGGIARHGGPVFVIEGPGGQLQVYSADEILDGYEAVDRRGEDLLGEAERHAIASRGDTAVIEERRPFAGEEPQNLSATDVARDAAADDPDRDLTPAELRARMDQAVAEAEAVNRRHADQAKAAGLVSEDEYEVWTQDGELPEGVTVTPHNDGSVSVSREPGFGPASALEPGGEPATMTGPPATADETATGPGTTAGDPPAVDDDGVASNTKLLGDDDGAERRDEGELDTPGGATTPVDPEPAVPAEGADALGASTTPEQEGSTSAE